ncbi:hypothetical protein [Hymenobacter sp. BT559]|uniref:hypothetical protein n=1 Tax=Hymenobacter sp. BT559 TaxID=2795729 RepID=UPI0018EDDDE6|nr:hypothetical protein [Hymenobacter sp. BT559]MBJ6145751.1 hypothetical protein [Hymenobacter sp. BT559]
MPFRAIYSETIKLLGFRSGGDFLSSTIGVKLYSGAAVQGLAIGTLVAGLTAFCTRWIWNPPSALYLLLFLDLANGRYGYQVAKKLKGEPFRWSEFQRLGGILISTVIVMAVVRNAINSYPYYDWMADLVFGWLFTTKARKVVEKMVALKVQEEGAASLFQYALKWLLNSKLGPILVDSIQQPPARAAAPAEPDPATDPTATP